MPPMIIKFKRMFLLLALMMLTSTANAKDWEVLKDEHFIIYYRSTVSEDFVKTVLDSAEDNFRQVLENLGVSRHQSWVLTRNFASPVFEPGLKNFLCRSPHLAISLSGKNGFGLRQGFLKNV